MFFFIDIYIYFLYIWTSYFIKNLVVVGEYMLHLREEQTIEIGQKIRVYRNLHKNMFSIQDATTKKVIGYGEGILLKNVKFRVQKKGQDKVRKTQQKSVHAFVVGEFAGIKTEVLDDYEYIYYNPYTTEKFVISVTHEEIDECKSCFLIHNKCYAKS